MTQISQLLPHETSLPGTEHFSGGKVRDVYESGRHRLLVITTHRLSAFDVVLGQAIPEKGRVLNQISCFRLDSLKESVKTQFITTNLDEYPEEFQSFAEQLTGRSTEGPCGSKGRQC